MQNVHYDIQERIKYSLMKKIDRLTYSYITDGVSRTIEERIHPIVWESIQLPVMREIGWLYAPSW